MNNQKIFCISVLSIAVILLLFFTSVNSFQWVNRPFHGFLVMKNMVVASISLPGWKGTKNGEIFQSKIIAVDGKPVRGVSEIWKRLTQAHPGETITYTFEKEGKLFPKGISTSLFTYKDFFLLFGLYILNGIAFFLTGVSVYFLRPKSSSSLALLIVGSTVGVFTLTACDLYSPYWLFNFHILSEAFLPASIFHLALTFPNEKIHSKKKHVFIIVPYFLSLFLGIFYEIFLFSHQGYVIIHNLCTLYFGIVLIFFIFSLFWNYLKTPSTVVRYKIRTVMWGAFFALSLPSVIVTYSAIKLGEFPVNSIAFTTFFFPLSLGYAIVKRNLFEIDKIIQRTLYYFIFSATIIGMYALVVISFNILFQGMNPTHSPYFVIPFILLIILLLNPLKEKLQGFVDRMFYHIHTDYQKVLKESSTTLTTLLNRDDICRHMMKNITEIISPEKTLLMVLDENNEYYRPLITDGFTDTVLTKHTLAKEDWLIKQLREKQKEITAFDIHNFYEEGPHNEFLSLLYEIKTQMVMPIVFKSEVEGLIIAGRKKSGFTYHNKDFEFLRTVANQAALSMANAKSYEALKKAQRELLHNEKLKIVGQMANMIIHDFKGPMTTIRCSAEFMTLDTLSDENRIKYCNRIMSEVDRLVGMSRELTEFSSGSKNLIFENHSVEAFIKDIAESLEGILQKNSITFNVNLNYKGELTFDYQKMKRVFLNFAHNAIEAMPDGGTFSIANYPGKKHIKFTLKDTGKGIPQRFLNKIFDPFFTFGKTGGTGLGLCIVKDIITNHNGDIWVTSEEGRGTAFHFTIASNLEEHTGLALKKSYQQQPVLQ